VLLAEDNATNQFALRRMLENMGAEVTPAKDGREALSAVRAHAFDIIVMDVMMPELDGLSAARAIRAMDAPRGKTPIIALTASAFAEDREAALAAGMEAYATKPIRARGLLEAIEACLKREPVSVVGESVSAVLNMPALDHKFLEQMAEDLGPMHLSKALEVFFVDLRKRADALRSEGEDPDRLRKAAHAIKGSAASFGFLRIAHVAEELETAARLGERARFSGLKSALLREADAAPDHMKAA